LNVEKRQSLEGELRNIVFSNESGSFVVARLNAEDGSMKTIVGNLAGVKAGEFLRLQGEWVENAKFGKQFQVATYLVQSPKTLVGLERYLSSGVLPGIGPKTAERIVQEFGTSTLEILEKQPEKLRKISGIGANRIEKIIAAWQTRRSLSEVMVFLQSNGISPAYLPSLSRKVRGDDQK
jgi:exodeoxyribonuclease V alpha subunit